MIFRSPVDTSIFYTVSEEAMNSIEKSVSYSLTPDTRQELVSLLILIYENFLLSVLGTMGEDIWDSLYFNFKQNRWPQLSRNFNADYQDVSKTYLEVFLIYGSEAFQGHLEALNVLADSGYIKRKMAHYKGSTDYARAAYFFTKKGWSWCELNLKDVFNKYIRLLCATVIYEVAARQQIEAFYQALFDPSTPKSHELTKAIYPDSLSPLENRVRVGMMGRPLEDTPPAVSFYTSAQIHQMLFGVPYKVRADHWYPLNLDVAFKQHISVLQADNTMIEEEAWVTAATIKVNLWNWSVTDNLTNTDVHRLDQCFAPQYQAGERRTVNLYMSEQHFNSKQDAANYFQAVQVALELQSLLENFEFDLDSIMMINRDRWV